MLHVVPSPLARGAQREARALADALDLPGTRVHRVLGLFDGPPEVRVDLTLGHRPGRVPAAGIDPRLVLRLRSALARLDPAVVVAHGGDPLKYLVPAMVGRRRPLAYYAIGTFAGHGPRRLQVPLWGALSRSADVVAAEGDEVAEELTALLGVPADRVVVTPNGRDPDRFRPRDRPRDDGRPVVCFVGALTDGKQPLRYVEAVAGARRAGAPPFRALLVGDGPLADRVGPAAASAGVEWLGARGDVDELLGGADVLVFPSLPTGEGMPGVLIEAGLSGLAVVATDVPGVRSVVEDGTTGVVVPSGDAGALTDALVGLLTDGDRRAALGRAARERCVSRFTLDEVAARWLSLLGPLLDRAG